MKILDVTFAWLLVVGSLLHAAGSFVAYKNMPGRQIASETHRDRPGRDLGQTGRDHEPGRVHNP